MTDIKTIVQEADSAFWQVIVKHFPQAKTGDLSPDRTTALSIAQDQAVREWIDNNVPAKDDA